MAKKKASIKWEIAAFTFALTAVVVAVLSVFSINSLKNSLTLEVESRGTSAAASMARNVADFMLVKYELETAKILKDALSGKGVKYAFVVDDKGIIKASSSMALIKTKYKVPEQDSVTSGGVPVVFDEAGDKVLDFTAPCVAKGRVKLGTAHLGISYAIIGDALNSAYINFGIITLIALVVGVAGSFFLGIRIAKPVAELERGSQLIGQGNLEHVIVINSENEIGRLADAFNKMTKDLKKAHVKELQQKTLQRELEIAREIQLSIIPKIIPEVQGYKIHTYYKAAEEVGGDYYDIVELGQGMTGVLVADVSGKGVPAALITALFSSMLHAQAEKTTDPFETVMNINTQIRKRITRGMFVTAFYGVINPAENTVEMVSAGHNETLVYRAVSGSVHKYAPKGFPIAMSPTELMRERVSKERFTMQPGDKMVVFTDGITEAMNSQKKEFGIDALVDSMKKYGKETGGKVMDGITADVKDFTQGYQQSDDIALVVVERVS
jgi:serine phosphatase RsbU (regulator of sigma subunit)